MARKVQEWIGKTPDSKPSAAVRQRILERENSTCHICKGEIQTGQRWEADHVPPLKDGGENRESKILPAHFKCHRHLTAQQAIERAPIEKKKQKNSGARQPKRSMQSRGFETPSKSPKIDKQAIDRVARVGRRQLYGAG